MDNKRQDQLIRIFEEAGFGGTRVMTSEGLELLDKLLEDFYKKKKQNENSRTKNTPKTF